MCIVVLSFLLIGVSSDQAATCTIQGQNLVVAYSKARVNGYKFKCSDLNIAKSVYSVPGRLGCKGRRKNPMGEIYVRLFSGKALNHGWKISDASARGGPGTISKTTNIGIGLKAKPPLMSKYDYYISKLFLKHSSKGYSNISSVITDAFGQ